MNKLSPKDLQELNRKMLEFAGFVLAPYSAFDIPIWQDSNGVAYLVEPDFTRSMDACIEHILPKLQEMGCSWYIGQPVGDIVHSHIHWIDSDKKFSGYDKEPSMAFCLAVEKMIDNKEEL